MKTHHLTQLHRRFSDFIPDANGYLRKTQPTVSNTTGVRATAKHTQTESLTHIFQQLHLRLQSLQMLIILTFQIICEPVASWLLMIWRGPP